MIHSDWHIHTDASYDAKLPIETLIQRAQEQGLRRFGVTDHANFNDEKFLGDLRRSAQSVQTHQAQCPSMVSGVELTPIEKPLFDYKFFCYDGKPKYVYVDTWKDGAHHINMYDVDFNLRRDVSMGYPTDMSDDIQKPACYEEMLQIAEKLSAGFPHVRVDLYQVAGRPVFGEMTFSKGAGFDKILPYSFDEEMGEDFHVRKYENQE